MLHKYYCVAASVVLLAASGIFKNAGFLNSEYLGSLVSLCLSLISWKRFSTEPLRGTELSAQRKGAVVTDTFCAVPGHNSYGSFP